MLTNLWIHIQPETEENSSFFDIRYNDGYQEEGWNPPIQINAGWIEAYLEEFLSLNLRYDYEIEDDPIAIFRQLLGMEGKQRFVELIVQSFKPVSPMFTNEYETRSKNWLGGYFRMWLEDNYVDLLAKDMEERELLEGVA